jgi:hypothetical protein
MPGGSWVTRLMSVWEVGWWINGRGRVLVGLSCRVVVGDPFGMSVCQVRQWINLWARSLVV